MKSKSILASIAFVPLLTALFFSEPLYGFQELFSFNGTNGSQPYAGLIQGSDGNFYGTTGFGGTSWLFVGSQGYGTVFQMTPAGALTTLVSFNGDNGSNPYGGLTEGNDHNFYGTTYDGGAYNLGTVFQMTSVGALTTLVSFNGTNGRNPLAALVQGGDGNFYGTTESDNANTNGTVFKMSPAGVLTTLVWFNGTNGRFPRAGLVQGSDSNFYGTTTSGGSTGDGTVFKMTPAGVLTTLVWFNGTNGSNPYAGLVQGSDGNFYGTTINGSGCDGTVFRMTPAGLLTTLVSFNDSNGDAPYAGGLLEGIDGNFYGTTYSGGTNGNGTLFRMTPSGVLTTLFSFSGTFGTGPRAGMAEASDGNLYGSTQGGGAFGLGDIYVYNIYNLNPEQATATPVVINGFTVEATVTYSGFDYTNVPGVYFVGGGGSGAQATATVSNGLVLAINMVCAGAGYTNAPTIIIAPPVVPAPDLGIALAMQLNFTNLFAGTSYQLQASPDSVTWSDAAAVFTATANANSQYVNLGETNITYRLVPAPAPFAATATATLDNGFVVAATVINGGSGYITAPLVSITGGGGSGAQATAAVSNGIVVAVNMISAGSEYTSTPSIQIAAPPITAMTPTIAPAIRLDFTNLTVNLPYQIQAAARLNNWTNFGPAFFAAQATNSQYLNIGSGSTFFRILYAP